MFPLIPLLVTWFGAGRAPKTPGTFGSLAALPFAYAVQLLGGNAALMAFSLAVFAAGVWACGRYVRETNRSDPSEAVIDEVAGMSLLLAALEPSWQGYAVAFVLFRLFDILKPWPVSWADQKVKGGLGIMLDDMLAAAMGIFALAMLLQFIAIPGVSLAYPAR